jgi:hypothetical protein
MICIGYSSAPVWIPPLVFRGASRVPLRHFLVDDRRNTRRSTIASGYGDHTRENPGR